MDKVPLKAQVRSADAVASELREQSVVPCVVYGNDVENTSIQCDYSELFRVYSKAGSSAIVELDVDGKKIPTIVHEITFDPVKDTITHVDFYAVNMKKEIEASIPLEFTGSSEAVESAGGVLVTGLDHLTVKCLPANLPHELKVDLSPLETFADSLTVSQIVVPEGVEILEEEDQVIATVQEPRKEKTPEEEAAEGAEGAAGESEEGGEGEGEKKEEAPAE